MVKNRRKKRKLKAKESQTIKLERHQWRCPGCGAALFPLDKAPGLLRGTYMQQVQEAVMRLGSRLPYAEAPEELARLWPMPISRSSVRQITMRHGAVANALNKQMLALRTALCNQTKTLQFPWQLVFQFD